MDTSEVSIFVLGYLYLSYYGLQKLQYFTRYFHKSFCKIGAKLQKIFG